MNDSLVQHSQLRRLVRQILQLGTRTLTAMVVALIAVLLLLASPEIGLGGAIGGVVAGAVSAVLIRPHAG